MRMDQIAVQGRPDYRDILTAAERISSRIQNTRIARNVELNEILGCDLWCKCENLQDTGAFKLRGATNAILSLRERGIPDDVATHSSGNHGAALARAAKLDGRKACVVMPRNSVPSKAESVKGLGAQLIFCEPDQQALEERVQFTEAVGPHLAQRKPM